MDTQTIKQRFGIIGNSAGLNNALSVALRVAPTDLSVLILGESGVGKEVFSQIIHALSPRKHQSFIAVNCGAIPEGTIDSELFGHEKGSFTGATDQRKGYFEVVNGGTIFLDEVGEMPVSTQARLLRVLETGEFIRVGSSKTLKTDVRVIAATNVNLAEMVKSGKFREDLYYRLNTVPINIPPLRERRDDIHLLFRKFVSDFTERQRITPIQLDSEARDLLINYDFPGNIRELKNLAEQMCILAPDRIITTDELLRFLPNAGRTYLPVRTAINGHYENGNTNYSERELLYKVFFEIKNDISDLKRLLAQVFNGQPINPNFMPNPSAALGGKDFIAATDYNSYPSFEERNPPVVVSSRTVEANHAYNNAEVVEESLSIADKEKELIEKALVKHKHKRREAALDLGISERTLYRKIKEYKIKEQ